MIFNMVSYYLNSLLVHFSFADLQEPTLGKYVSSALYCNHIHLQGCSDYQGLDQRSCYSEKQDNAFELSYYQQYINSFAM